MGFGAFVFSLAGPPRTFGPQASLMSGRKHSQFRRETVIPNTHRKRVVLVASSQNGRGAEWRRCVELNPGLEGKASARKEYVCRRLHMVHTRWWPKPPNLTVTALPIDVVTVVTFFHFPVTLETSPSPLNLRPDPSLLSQAHLGLDIRIASSSLYTRIRSAMQMIRGLWVYGPFL